MTFKNAISWFEIPVNDMERAQTFYETIFSCKLQPMELDNLKMAMFPVEESTVGGALCHAPGFYETGQHGVVIYLNGGDDLQFVLSKVEEAGGKVLMPKTQITPEYGYMALFTDTEGNRLGLHSMG